MFLWYSGYNILNVPGLIPGRDIFFPMHTFYVDFQIYIVKIYMKTLTHDTQW